MLPPKLRRVDGGFALLDLEPCSFGLGTNCTLGLRALPGRPSSCNVGRRHAGTNAAEALAVLIDEVLSSGASWTVRSVRFVVEFRGEGASGFGVPERGDGFADMVVCQGKGCAVL